MPGRLATAGRGGGRRSGGRPSGCPQIISPDIIAEVAARRAKAAPKVAPPRATNGPALLTGILRCNAPGCGAGMTIRTRQSGRYIYHAYDATLTAAAGRCESRAIRQDGFDRVRREMVAAKTPMRRLLEMVEDGPMSPRDAMFAERWFGLSGQARGLDKWTVAG